MAWRGACRSLLRRWPIMSVGVVSNAVVQNTAGFSLPGKMRGLKIKHHLILCLVIFHLILVDCCLRNLLMSFLFCISVFYVDFNQYFKKEFTQETIYYLHKSM